LRGGRGRVTVDPLLRRAKRVGCFGLRFTVGTMYILKGRDWGKNFPKK